VTYTAPQSSSAAPRLPASAVLATLILVLAAGGLPAQGAVRQATAFRKDPGGVMLANIREGSTVTTGKVQGDWTAVTLMGWVYAASTGKTSRDGFDLRVTADGGENLRAEPNGAIVARLQRGALLNQVAERGGWIQVRRSGWVSSSALGSNPSSPPSRAAQAAPPTGTATGAATPSAGEGAADRVEALRPTALVLAPDGAELATLKQGTSGQVLDRQGEWVQVQVQGWVRETDLSEPASAAIPGVTLAQVRADPAKYVGQLLEWRVQLISIQTADELRPEIPVGAKYLLTRGPLPEPGFVYVMVTAPQLATFEAAPPLQEFTLRGRLRAAQTRYLPTPVLELVQVVESRGRAP